MKNMLRSCIIIILSFIFYVNLNFVTLPKSFATEFGRPSTYSVMETFYTGLEYYGCYYKQKSTALIIYNLIYGEYLKHRSEERADYLRRTDMIFNAVTHLDSNDKSIGIINDYYNSYLKLPIVNNRIACCHFCNELRKNHIQAFLIGTKTSNILAEDSYEEFVVYVLEKSNSDFEYWAANFEDEPKRMLAKDFVKMGYKIVYYFEPADGLDFVFYN